jgi:hypothetical protein
MEALVTELADRIAADSRRPWLRVAVDGAPAADPAALADALVDALKLRGRPVLRISADDFLRPASVRLEYGHHDPDAFYQDRLDLGALRREVLEPLGPDGTGKVLPTFWDTATDRATRAPYVNLARGGVLLLDGATLIGLGLDLDLTVHLSMNPAALARHTPPEDHWTLPAYERYAEEAQPETYADVTIRVNDPKHPALVEH